jgi:hypothetical protein
MKLTKEQMQQILLRLINYDTVRYDNYYTVNMLLPDDVANILRGRA